MFSFESSARKDLARSLTKAGAPKVSQAVAEFEGLVQQYHSLFIAKDVFPDMKYMGEARQLLAHADAVCHAFEDISPPTRIRLEEERLERKSFLWMSMRSRLMMSACSQFMQWVTVIVRSRSTSPQQIERFANWRPT